MEQEDDTVRVLQGHLAALALRDQRIHAAESEREALHEQLLEAQSRLDTQQRTVEELRSVIERQTSRLTEADRFMLEVDEALRIRFTVEENATASNSHWNELLFQRDVHDLRLAPLKEVQKERAGLETRRKRILKYCRTVHEDLEAAVEGMRRMEEEHHRMMQHHQLLYAASNRRKQRVILELESFSRNALYQCHEVSDVLLKSMGRQWTWAATNLSTLATVVEQEHRLLNAALDELETDAIEREADGDQELRNLDITSIVCGNVLSPPRRTDSKEGGKTPWCVGTLESDAEDAAQEGGYGQWPLLRNGLEVVGSFPNSPAKPSVREPPACCSGTSLWHAKRETARGRMGSLSRKDVVDHSAAATISELQLLRNRLLREDVVRRVVEHFQHLKRLRGDNCGASIERMDAERSQSSAVPPSKSSVRPNGDGFGVRLERKSRGSSKGIRPLPVEDTKESIVSSLMAMAAEQHREVWELHIHFRNTVYPFVHRRVVEALTASSRERREAIVARRYATRVQRDAKHTRSIAENTAVALRAEHEGAVKALAHQHEECILEVRAANAAQFRRSCVKHEEAMNALWVEGERYKRALLLDAEEYKQRIFEQWVETRVAAEEDYHQRIQALEKAHDDALGAARRARDAADEQRRLAENGLREREAEVETLYQTVRAITSTLRGVCINATDDGGILAP